MCVRMCGMLKMIGVTFNLDIIQYLIKFVFVSVKNHIDYIFSLR